MCPSVCVEIDSSCPILVPSLIHQAQSLAHKGYNPAEAITLKDISSPEVRRRYLKQNLETTINHVFEDSVVSFTNYYQLNSNQEIVTYPDGTVLSIDPEERGGLNELGIRSAITSALENPDQVVLLYSPPGPVVFDDNPHTKFKDMKPYCDGQLYMMFSDGDKVNNVAISISSEGETWISELMSYEYNEAESKGSSIEKVKHLITHPILTGIPIEDFINTMENSQDRILFKNKDGRKFFLSETFNLIRKSLGGQLVYSSVVDQIMQYVDIENITINTIDQIYGALAQHYMKERGIETLTLGGSCGGTEIQHDIFSNGLLDNLSASFRKITQGENIFKISKDYRDDPNLCRCSAASGPHFHCPGTDKKTKEPCSHAIVVGEGTSTCPSCGTKKTC